MTAKDVNITNCRSTSEWSGVCFENLAKALSMELRPRLTGEFPKVISRSIRCDQRVEYAVYLNTDEFFFVMCLNVQRQG